MNKICPKHDGDWENGSTAPEDGTVILGYNAMYLSHNMFWNEETGSWLEYIHDEEYQGANLELFAPEKWRKIKFMKSGHFHEIKIRDGVIDE